MSDTLERETYGTYAEEWIKEKEDIESKEMWLELALLAERGLPYPKTAKVDAEKKQLALERAILETEFLFDKKDNNERVSESDCANQESGQSE